MAWTDIRMPRKRGRVNVPVLSITDVCFISGKELRGVDGCMPAVVDDDRCVDRRRADRAGLADIDERLRAVELAALFDAPLAEVQEELGADVVVLESPDASPPPGKVGIFSRVADDGRRGVAADGSGATCARTARSTAPTCRPAQRRRRRRSLF